MVGQWPRQRVRSELVAALAAVLLLALGAGGAAAAGASWLDGPPKGWNTPGMAAPASAPAMQNTDPRCQARQVAATTPEQKVVAGAGWTLEGYWPPIQQGSLTLITALANYDGMCRPMQFNVFVFSGGSYAGTLSPVPMDSRSDGVLSASPSGGALSASGGTITAQFTRYAPTDPLCCPSRGRTEVVYQVQQVNGSPVVVPVTFTAISADGQPLAAAPTPAPAKIPVQMPATGAGGGSSLALIVGATAMLAAAAAAAVRFAPRRGAVLRFPQKTER